MPPTTDILRRRNRRQAERAPLKWAARLLLSLATLLVLFGGFVIINGALLYAGIAHGLPAADEIETIYGAEGLRAYQPVRVYDNSGNHLLFEALHPAAEERRWLRLDPVYNTLSVDTLQALVIAQDPTFWDNNGYQRGRVLETILGGIFSPLQEAPSQSITQQLAAMALSPLDGEERSPSIEFLRLAALASDLTELYSKRTILEWYLNTADFGNLCYGLDAASLVYFGIHASELNLSQSAMLASIPSDPASNPFDNLPAARRNQRAVLREMVQAGQISQTQADQAQRQVLNLNQSAHLDNLLPEFAQLAFDQTDAILGYQAHQRPGLSILTTIDFDLQQQLTCTMLTQQARLNSQSPTEVIPVSEGTNCLAAELLPPLRPGDAGVDHQLDGLAGVIFEPQTGRLLAISGPALTPRPSGTAFSPFIYLTAFSQGYAPATMTLDIPPEGDIPSIFPESDQYEGPQRMRTSMANDLNAATLRTLELVGMDGLLRITRPLGLSSLDRAEDQDLTEVPLLNLAYAYAVLANRGWMAGVDATAGDEAGYVPSLQPAVVTGILNGQGQALYHYSPIEKSIASPQLSYLINDILADESARQLEFGQSALFDVGRTAAIKNGATYAGNDYWTIGYTPNLLVAVWAGGTQDRNPVRVSALNSSMPIWNAVFRYTARTLTHESWEVPPGVTEMEVCDPSGLLPTQYCPTTVRETFINGTEPTRPDDIFQPVRINRETGNLATVLTPEDLVEERVFMILPSEADQWAAAAGIQQPPDEFDSLAEAPQDNPEVRISSPSLFDRVGGELTIRGDARPEDMESFRLLYGQGLNPGAWVQIGQEHRRAVTGGVLGRWDTTGLDGVYTLQLEVVDSEGRLMADYVPLSLDNTPPTIEIQLPEPDFTFSLADASSFIIQANIEDAVGLSEVRIYVNNQLAAAMESGPYSLRWTVDEPGEYQVTIRAEDLTGNLTESGPVTVTVLP